MDLDDGATGAAAADPAPAPPSTDLRYGTAQARWVIAAMVLGSGIVFLDGTVVNVALPAIGSDLDTSLGGMQWTVNAYLITLSALLLLGGSLGDRYGSYLHLDQMSPWLPKAVIAIEDRRFFQHPGIDPLGVMRAFMRNLEEGRVVHDGPPHLRPMLDLGHDHELRPAPALGQELES